MFICSLLISVLEVFLEPFDAIVLLVIRVNSIIPTYPPDGVMSGVEVFPEPFDAIVLLVIRVKSTKTLSSYILIENIEDS